MINIGLFGAGVIGRVHAANIAQSDNAQLTHIVDIHAETAEALAQTCGGKPCTDPAQVFDDPSVDAVIIGSNTQTHAEFVIAAARSGKAILCEKPIAEDLANARRCIEVARNAGVLAVTGFNRRFDRNHRALWNQVREGRIGRMDMLHLTSRSEKLPKLENVPGSGGMLREKGTHHYDLARWIADDEAVEVFATGACRIEKKLADHGDLDTAMIILRFAGGAFCHFDFSRQTNYGCDERIEAFGSGGMLESRHPQAGNLRFTSGPQIVENGLHQSWLERFRESYSIELAAFIEAIKTGTSFLPTLEDGLAAQKIAEAVVRSVSENRPVRLDEFD
ncbi:Gfo/Idh/MocA family oxidoreductase [Pelagibius sp. Alg239-R121]|uniref:Gfo/Idh/MocA family oxidoreductase n=1 Tax=Pelagibius sp. Alg239-R121 TaxID=2993448 RepID=UPI0024A73766|nr:Gfo/Idh/MocA family oxidoreductase [Pelagibius sp. Alg239-R121]